jgi:hypothetical protein
MYAMIDNSDIETVFVLGDFNAHPGESFCSELLTFCSERELICEDINNLGIQSGTYTLICEAHGCKRWLDHCIATQSAVRTIVNVKVIYDSYWSDHFPMLINCNIQAIRVKTTTNMPVYNSVVWGERKPYEINEYTEYCNNILKSVDLLPEFSLCADNYCIEPLHKNMINDL